MTKKLTLSIDEKVVASAKKYAQSNNTSVSKIVSNFLSTLNSGVRLTPQNKTSDRVSKLAGAFSVPKDLQKAYYNKFEKKQYAK